MYFRLAIFAAFILSAIWTRQVTANEGRIVFESDIQPLLAMKCGKCHRHEVRKGGLDLSTMQSLRRGGETGEPLVNDSLEESLLWTLIDAGEMPPEDEPRLTEDELSLIRGWLASGAQSDAPQHSVEESITQHSVLPILLLRCTTCHGARLREGGLDLRTVAGIRAGGEHGPAIVAGDADASPMIQRIENKACPPSDKLLKFFVRRPPKSEVETLREWIAAGAPGVEPCSRCRDLRTRPTGHRSGSTALGISTAPATPAWWQHRRFHRTETGRRRASIVSSGGSRHVDSPRPYRSGRNAARDRGISTLADER